MELSDKIVDFSLCVSCKHWLKEEKEEPCCDCLLVPGRKDSHVPLYFEEEIDRNKIKDSKLDDILKNRRS